MIYTQLNNPARQNIAEMYKITLTKAEEIRLLQMAEEGISGLSKAEQLGILTFDGLDIEKGRKAMPIGSHANWGDTEYLKTASGWKPVGKYRGNVKQHHDHIHKNADADRDHLEMTADAGKMNEHDWSKKHGSTLHSKYKEVHEYLHQTKQDKNSTPTNSPDEKVDNYEGTKFDYYGDRYILDQDIEKELDIQFKYWSSYGGKDFFNAGALIVKIRRFIEAQKADRTKEIKQVIKHAGGKPALNETGLETNKQIRNLLQLTFYNLVHGAVKPVIAEAVIEKAKVPLMAYKAQIQKKIMEQERKDSQARWNQMVTLSVKHT